MATRLITENFAIGIIVCDFGDGFLECFSAWLDFKNFLCKLLADFGNYQEKSNEIPLQLPDLKSIFPVTITFSEIVFEFLSN